MDAMLSKMPKALFVIAVALTLLGYGISIGLYELFPYEIIVSGIKTAKVLLHSTIRKDRGAFKDFVEIAPEDATSHRINSIANQMFSSPVLFYGGRFQFSEYCPDEGCLAVQYSTAGEMTHAYPFKANEILQANISPNFAYEDTGFIFQRDARPIGMSQYRNGDLLVVFQDKDTFPYAGGIARIGRDGKPKWFRRDYSHHWPTILENGNALVPGLQVGTKNIVITHNNRLHTPLHCVTEKPYLDTINVLDGDGQLITQIPLIDRLLNSPFRAALLQTTDACDPIHLNYIDIIEKSPVDSDRIKPGDLIVSLRNISAFGIIDGNSGHFKDLIRGAFFQQHSVQHLSELKFLMFDNLGRGETRRPSRLLMFDLSTGKETTIFPKRTTPDSLRNLFSSIAGKVDISPDKQSAIVTFSDDSTAVEVSLPDGEGLNVFYSLHNVSDVEGLPDKRKTNAAMFRLYGVDYASEYSKANR